MKAYRAVPPPPARGGLACYVFTEGRVTEPEYLDTVKRFGDRLRIKVDNRHGGPDVILPLAIDLANQLRAEGREGEPEIWCVFDHDGDNRADLDRSLKRAESAGVRVAFSHPCFELWLLLHCRDYGAPANGRCVTVAQELRRFVPDYQKRIRFDRLRGQYPRARERAVRLDQRHQRDAHPLPSQRDPSTNVYELIDRLGVSY